MNVKELKPKAAVDEITLKIDSIDEPRTVRNGSLTVANATASDSTGQVTITLWNDDINRIKVGDSIKITKGWVGEYQGQLQLSAGKFGKLEVVASGGAEAPKKAKKSADVDVDEDII
jgi:replication factor A1